MPATSCQRLSSPVYNNGWYFILTIGCKISNQVVFYSVVEGWTVSKVIEAGLNTKKSARENCTQKNHALQITLRRRFLHQTFMHEILPKKFQHGKFHQKKQTNKQKCSLRIFINPPLPCFPNL